MWAGARARRRTRWWYWCAAAALAAQHFWAARPRSVQAPEKVSAEAVRPRSGRCQGGRRPRCRRAAPPSPAAADRVVIDVSGKVREPGSPAAAGRIAGGRRAACGGRVQARRGPTALNRARVLTDGEQVVVGGRPPPAVNAGGAAVAAVPGTPRGPAGRGRRRRGQGQDRSVSTPPRRNSWTRCPASAPYSPSTSSTTAPGTAVSGPSMNSVRSPASATGGSPTSSHSYGP